MKLYYYQLDTIQLLRESLRKGNRKILVCKPTGSGKTVVFTNILSTVLQRGYRCGILVHRAELIDQAFEKLIDAGVDRSSIAIIKGSNYHFKGANVLLASVQTLKNRVPYFDSSETPAFWIIDEVHRQEFDSCYDRPELKHAIILGFTATPMRQGKMMQLGDIYEDMIEPITIKRLVDEGYLSRPTYILPSSEVETSGIGMDNKTGDFRPGESFNVFNKPEVYSGLIDGYEKAGMGKAMVFCSNVEHSKITADEFRKRGYNATWVDGTMKKESRDKIVSSFKKDGFNIGNIDVITNCDIFTTGFDCPNIKVIGLNRATVSIPLFLQMIGRGSRIIKGSKNSFFVIDAGTNTKRLGYWEEERVFSLWHKVPTKKGAAPVKDCNGCSRIIPASMMKCVYCGYEFERNSDAPKITEGWEMISFEEVMKISAVSQKSRQGQATVDDIVYLKNSRSITRPYQLFKRAIVNNLDLYEVADRCGYDRGAVDRFNKWAKEKGII